MSVSESVISLEAELAALQKKYASLLEAFDGRLDTIRELCDERRSLKMTVDDLLEALKSLSLVPAVVQVLGTNHTGGCDCPMCRARKAIAKAEGH